MVTDKSLKLKVVKLRKDGNSYTDINKILKTHISKSTLSSWLKNLQLTSSQKAKLNNNILNKINFARNKGLKTLKIKQGLHLKELKDKNLFLLKNINNDIQKLLLSILFLGEGSKTKSTKNLCLGSANPDIIKLYLKLLRNCFKVDETKFRIRIQCRSDQDVKKLENFWSNITKIPKEKIYPTYIDKRSIGKPTKQLNYKGVCVIYYFDRSIQFELEFLSNSVIKYVVEGS